jgi:hypothetical protein
MRARNDLASSCALIALLNTSTGISSFDTPGVVALAAGAFWFGEFAAHPSAPSISMQSDTTFSFEFIDLAFPR